MNLLYIFSDQHNKFITGCYNNPYVHTPNLDRLAAKGVTFDSAYCNNPICCPSRASMTTGEYSFQHGYWDNAHPYKGEQEGWGHRLTDQGHEVVTIGKLHYQSIASTSEGFPDQRIPLHVKDDLGDITHCIRDGIFTRPKLRDTVLNAGPGNSDYLEYDKKVGELAVEFLSNEASGKDKPWCLFVGFVCPHFPWKVPQDIMDLYTPYDKIPLPKDWEPGKRPEHGALQVFRNELHLAEAFTEEEYRKAIAAYYGMVTYLDRQIGDVLDALEAAGLSENTRIIYTTDHGDNAGDHGLFFKHNMYEGSVAVPLIMAGPDLPEGTRVNSAVSLLDIFPTVLEAVGADSKPEDEGKPGLSLFPFARGEKSEDRPIFSETHCIGNLDAGYMIRYKQYKYNYYMNYKPQLFDLENDPGEFNDLIDDPAYSALVEEMDGILRGICNPEEINKAAHERQAKTLAEHGGKEAVIDKLLAYTPIPTELIS